MEKGIKRVEIWDMMRTFVLSEGTSSIYWNKLTHKYKYDGNNPTYFILFMVIVKTTILIKVTLIIFLFPLLFIHFLIYVK
jgi:hypothetical protein